MNTVDAAPAAPRPCQVLVTGAVTFNTLIYLDEFPQPAPQTVFSRACHETIGGTAAGKALNLQRLGLRVTLHTLLGADEYGERLRARLTQTGIELLAEPDPAGTQRHVNLMDAHGRRISIFVAYGTSDPEMDLVRLERVIASSDAVVLNISPYCRRLIPLCRAHSKPLWCDIHDYDGQTPYHADFIAAADYLFLSSDRLPAYRDFMEQQIAAGKQLVVCTHGAQGATALTAAGEWWEEPIIADYALRDSNGAGDAFFAGFFYGHTQGYDVRTALRLATIVGGLCVTSPELYHPTLSPALVAAEYRRHYG